MFVVGQQLTKLQLIILVFRWDTMGICVRHTMLNGSQEATAVAKDSTQFVRTRRRKTIVELQVVER